MWDRESGWWNERWSEKTRLGESMAREASRCWIGLSSQELSRDFVIHCLLDMWFDAIVLLRHVMLSSIPPLTWHFNTEWWLGSTSLLLLVSRWASSRKISGFDGYSTERSSENWDLRNKSQTVRNWQKSLFSDSRRSQTAHKWQNPLDVSLWRFRRWLTSWSHWFLFL
jgi:hypothetical protein